MDFQPLVDKAARKLSTWNGRNLSQAGRACLTKVVLTSQPVYLLTVVKPPKEVLKDIDKIRRRFLWAGDKALSGGKCKVNWTKTSLPRDLGGLGLLNLEKFARAFRLRWLWQEWTAIDKAWVGTEVPCDDFDRQLFAHCTRISLGNGKKATFWLSGWLQGKRPKDLAPLLYAKSRRKKRKVAEALQNDNWIRDLNHPSGFTTAHYSEFIMLWTLIDQTSLHSEQEDSIAWARTRSAVYTTASAYRAQLDDHAPNPSLSSVWKAWTPPKCKFFAWLILQNRVWTTDRLARRNWDHCPVCPLCRSTLETAHHLLTGCRFSRQIWTLVATWIRLHSLQPTEWSPSTTTSEWWFSVTTITDTPRKALCSLVLLVSWEIWKERNNHIFDRR
jgi:hypothetical protein